MKKNETTYDFKQFMLDNRAIIESILELIEDKNGNAMYPCLHSVKFSADELKQINRDLFDVEARNSYKDLFDSTGVIQPLVITADKRIVNGVGRFFYCLSKGIKEFDCVVIPGNEAKLASLMLNKLTMDFELDKKYGDVLRYNSYRRSCGIRDWLGMTYTIGLTNKSSKEIDIFNPVHKYQFESVYGKTILDFGAGMMEEVEILNKNGFKAVPLEPFVLRKKEDGKGHYDELDIHRARRLIGEFLDEVENGISFDSVISQTVLNSIPFRQDREMYLLLLSFFCDENTVAYIGTNGAGRIKQTLENSVSKTKELQSTRLFRLEYEENITIGDIKKTPKVQKFHSEQEFAELIIPYFKEIKYLAKDIRIYAICKAPTLNFSKEQLIEAIDFEFNLPYPNNQRLNMHVRAKEVLLKRWEKLKK